MDGDLTWMADKRVSLPANLNSYTVALTLYDGHEYILDANSAVPYGLLQVERGANFIQFRPRTPRGFLALILGHKLTSQLAAALRGYSGLNLA